jgi:hypothetical protein
LSFDFKDNQDWVSRLTLEAAIFTAPNLMSRCKQIMGQILKTAAGNNIYNFGA